MRAEIDDALNFRDTLGEKGIHDTRQQRKAALRELHNRRPTAGRWNDICGQLSTTSILKEVDRAREVHDPTSAPTHLGVFASWQLYSGLSHGKHWATLVALDRLDQSLGESSDVKSVMLTSSLKLVAHGMQTGVSLLDLTLRTYGKRARRWSALPEDSKEPKKTNYPARGG
jgi:hypothetical protein